MPQSIIAYRGRPSPPTNDSRKHSPRPALYMRTVADPRDKGAGAILRVVRRVIPNLLCRPSLICLVRFRGVRPACQIAHLARPPVAVRDVFGDAIADGSSFQ